MKFTVQQKVLDAIIKTMSGTTSSDKEELTSHLLFRAVSEDSPDKDGSEDDVSQELTQVEVLSYSGRVFSAVRFQPESLDCSTYQRFTVEAKRLKASIAVLEKNDSVTLKFNGSSTEIVCRLGKGRFRSFDPGMFPYWDSTLANAKKTAVLDAQRLKAILSYARQFASEDETKVPQLCLCEFREGDLLATDRVGLVKISVAGMQDSELRIHVRDIPALLKFLQACGKREVTILEHERASFFRSSQSLFGASRVRVRFPKIRRAGLEADRWWTISKDLLERKVRFMIASAVEEDQNRLVFIPDHESSQLELVVTAVTGDPIQVTVPCLMEEKPDVAPLPEGGFSVSHRYLMKILEEYGREAPVPEPDSEVDEESIDNALEDLEEGGERETEETSAVPEGVTKGDVLVDIGVNRDKKGTSGFLLFEKQDGPDKYVTVLSWVE